jgi:hypothetical protein
LAEVSSGSRLSRKKEAPVPWDPLPLDVFEIRAFKALHAGNANDLQQKTVLDVILNKFAGTYDQSFRPGPDGCRATDFAEGKRWVGNRIIHTIKRTVESNKEPS